MKRKDVAEEISEDIIYIGLVEGVKKLSNPWAVKDLHELFLIFDATPAMVIQRSDNIIIGGNQSEQVKIGVRNFLFNGYYINEHISHKDISSGKCIDIYFLEPNKFLNLIGLS